MSIFLLFVFLHIAQLYLGGGDFLGFGVVFSFFCLLGFVLGGVVAVCCACEVDGSSCFCGWCLCNLHSYCELFSFNFIPEHFRWIQCVCLV